MADDFVAVACSVPLIPSIVQIVLSALVLRQMQRMPESDRDLNDYPYGQLLALVVTSPLLIVLLVVRFCVRKKRHPRVVHATTVLASLIGAVLLAAAIWAIRWHATATCPVVARNYLTSDVDLNSRQIRPWYWCGTLIGAYSLKFVEVLVATGLILVNILF